MSEEITIKIRAETEDAQQNVQEFREELDKTAKSSDRTTRSLGKMTNSWQRMGATLKNRVTPKMGLPTTVQGPMGYGYGTGGGMGMGGMFGGRLGGLGKLGMAAGIGAIGGSLLGNLFGGAGGKLAGFDKLNAIGQQDLFDFLEPRFKDISKQLGNIGGSLDSLTGSLSNVGGGIVNISTNVFTGIQATVKSIGSTIAHWFDGLEPVGQAIFGNILDLAHQINGVTHGWFSGLYEEGNRVFSHILDLAGSVLDTIKGWFDTSSGGSTAPEPETTPAPTDSGSTSLLGKAINAVTGTVKAFGAAVTSTLDAIGEKTGLTSLLEKGNNMSKSVTSVLDGINSTLLGTPSSPTATGKGGLAGEIAAGIFNTSSLTKAGTTTSMIPLVLGGLADSAASLLTKGVSGAKEFGEGVYNGLRSVLGFAEGGVFLPNQPQLAILGDNKAEPEVAAPYSLIVQAVGDALRNNGGMVSSTATEHRTIEVPISLNGKVIARGIYDDLESEKRRRNGTAMS